MLSDDGADRDAITAALDALAAAHDTVAALSFDTLTHPELLAALSRLETHRRCQPVVEHRLIARLAAEASPVELGGTSLSNVLATRLRISQGEARRRIDEADDLGPRSALTGEPLPPRLAHTGRMALNWEDGLKPLCWKGLRPSCFVL